MGSPPLFIAFGTLLVTICAFWALICARGYQVPPAGTLRMDLDIEWRVPLSVGTHLGIFAILVSCMTVAWIWSVRAATGSRLSLTALLAGTTVLAAPLLLLTGIYSDDVYLYHLYGRELVHYGANPLLTPPAAIEGDPHLKWVYWKWLPSAYGPLWLLMSAPLSAAAGESIGAAVVLYRAAGLAGHLLACVLLHAAVRRMQPDRATVATIFYAWNPFVLFESVASAHNDAWVVAFFCGVLWAVAGGRLAVGGVLLGCAVMIKPFAALAAIPFAGTLWAATPRPLRLGRALQVGIAFVLTMTVLYVPFNAGDALLRNVLANPASGTYMNSVWELAAIQFGGWSGPMRDAAERSLDPVRMALLALAVAAGFVASLRTGRFTTGLIVSWTGFCAAQAWVWPWYFLPIVAIAAAHGRGVQRVAVALSLGGLLYYLAWPPPVKSFGWLYTWRSLLLFGPAVLVAAAEAWSRRGRPLNDPTAAAYPSALP